MVRVWGGERTVRVSKKEVADQKVEERKKNSTPSRGRERGGVFRDGLVAEQLLARLVQDWVLTTCSKGGPPFLVAWKCYKTKNRIPSTA